MKYSPNQFEYAPIKISMKTNLRLDSLHRRGEDKPYAIIYVMIAFGCTCMILFGLFINSLIKML